MSLRLTKDVVDVILRRKEGLEFDTTYSRRNFRQFTHYKVTDGKILEFASGKSSWDDSHFNEMYECDPNKVRRLIRTFSEKFGVEL